MVATRSQKSEADDRTRLASADDRTRLASADSADSSRHDQDLAHPGHDQRGCPAHVLKENDSGGADDDDPDSPEQEAESASAQLRSCAILAALAIVTYATYPGAQLIDKSFQPDVHTVFYYGWVSAMSTGLGVLPLYFAPEMDPYWIGVSNAVAAGMMCAASYSLVYEGCTFSEPGDDSTLSAPFRTTLGAVLGLLFILGTKSFLERHEDIKVGSLKGADARKILLIVFVMTLHSFSEGVGIGVSFGGEHGGDLGVFISASLAVHNIPEGLAVAIVLLPRKISKATAAIWCVFTSMPQPIMAVPAFMFVHSFLPILPVGLGFAGGAMMWVAFMELLMEAYEDTDMVTTGVVSSVALAAMLAVQKSIEEHS